MSHTVAAMFLGLKLETFLNICVISSTCLFKLLPGRSTKPRRIYGRISTLNVKRLHLKDVPESSCSQLLKDKSKIPFLFVVNDSKVGHVADDTSDFCPTLVSPREVQWP